MECEEQGEGGGGWRSRVEEEVGVVRNRVEEGRVRRWVEEEQGGGGGGGL